MPSGAAVGRIAPEGTTKKRFRPDIQGLRALAVVVVILNHLFGWPAGGFVGVDVFFVISGFLITGLLYREHERTGRISFVDFYRRRVKRIIPIATIVIVVTVAISFVVYFTARAQSILNDGVWALLFASNWHSAFQGTNYWADDGTVSPLQHYWSLAVEEQFYVVWPWLIVAAFAVASRRSWDGRARRSALLVLMGTITIASFGWAIAQTITNPGFAYFSTFVRAWELGVGAMVAIAAPVLSKIPQAWCTLLG